MAEEINENITWTRKLEEYFAHTGERAQCLSIAHKKSEALYAKRRTYIDLPVIVLSSVTGFCSVGSGVMFEGQEKLSSIILGTVSLFVGILNTTGSYFGWAKRSEAHRISAIHYARLHRFMRIEMSLPRDERMTPHDLLKYCKDQYERLAEISPLIPGVIISEFKSQFRKVDNVDFPEEMNGLDPIEIFDSVKDSLTTEKKVEDAKKILAKLAKKVKENRVIAFQEQQAENAAAATAASIAVKVAP